MSQSLLTITSTGFTAIDKQAHRNGRPLNHAGFMDVVVWGDHQVPMTTLQSKHIINTNSRQQVALVMKSTNTEHLSLHTNPGYTTHMIGNEEWHVRCQITRRARANNFDDGNNMFGRSYSLYACGVHQDDICDHES